MSPWCLLAVYPTPHTRSEIHPHTLPHRSQISQAVTYYLPTRMRLKCTVMHVYDILKHYLLCAVHYNEFSSIPGITTKLYTNAWRCKLYVCTTLSRIIGSAGCCYDLAHIIRTYTHITKIWSSTNHWDSYKFGRQCHIDTIVLSPVWVNNSLCFDLEVGGAQKLWCGRQFFPLYLGLLGENYHPTMSMQV